MTAENTDLQQGALLRKRREDKGMSGQDLSEALYEKFGVSVSSQTIISVENGKNRLRYELAGQCAYILGVGIDSFSTLGVDIQSPPMFPQSFKNKMGRKVVHALRKACDQLDSIFDDSEEES